MGDVTIKVIQEPGGEFEYGPSPSAVLNFKVACTEGEETQYDVYHKGLLGATDPLYDLFGDGSVWIKRERIWFKLLANHIWEATVSYGTFPQPGDEPSYSFEAGGGTRHVTQSLATIGRYGPGGENDTPDHDGAIGVSGDGSVVGVDVPCKQYNWTETHYLPHHDQMPAYRLTVAGLAGSVNESAFGLYAPGTVLFRHATGGRRGLGDWEIMFHFSFSPDAVNLKIGRITVPKKPGWAYLWTQYQPYEDTGANALAQRPRGAYVEKIFEAANFNLLGI